MDPAQSRLDGPGQSRLEASLVRSSVKSEVPSPALPAASPLAQPAPLPRHAPAVTNAVASAGAAQPIRAAVETPSAAAALVLRQPSQSAAAQDSDSDGVEVMIPPMPCPLSLLVGRRVAWRVSTAPGCSVLREGSVAALVTMQAHQENAPQRLLFRVSFEDGEEVLWEWRELHPWVRRDDSDIPQQLDTQPAAAAPAPVPSPAPSVPVSAPPTAAAAAVDSGGAPRKQYKGVSADLGDPTLFRTETRQGTVRTTCAGIATAEEAAHVYDNGRREQGKRVVNFPRDGTNEVQAVPYETDVETLRRVEPDVEHCRAQYAPRFKIAKPAKMELRSRASAAVATPAAAPPPAAAAAAAAAPSLPAPVDSLIGRRVRCRSMRTVAYEPNGIGLWWWRSTSATPDTRFVSTTARRCPSRRRTCRHSASSPVQMQPVPVPSRRRSASDAPSAAVAALLLPPASLLARLCRSVACGASRAAGSVPCCACQIPCASGWASSRRSKRLCSLWIRRRAKSGRLRITC